MGYDAFVKGLNGEIHLLSFLQIHLSSTKYIHNIALPKNPNKPENNGTNQIDFILFTRRGFYCIEAKAWNGNIVAIDDAYCSIKTNNRIIHRANPVIQNRAHLHTICKYSDYDYIPLLVFTGFCTLSGFKENACTMENLEYYINSKPIIYSEEEVLTEYNKFLKLQSEFKLMNIGHQLGQVYSIKNGK